MKTQREDGQLQAKEGGLEQIPPSWSLEGTNSAPTLILDFRPPELGKNTFLPFKSLSKLIQWPLAMRVAEPHPGPLCSWLPITGLPSSPDSHTPQPRTAPPGSPPMLQLGCFFKGSCQVPRRSGMHAFIPEPPAPAWSLASSSINVTLSSQH